MKATSKHLLALSPCVFSVSPLPLACFVFSFCPLVFFQQVSKLDAWKTKMCLITKRTIRAGAGPDEDADEEDDVDLT